jgi:hypothetical protein
VLGGPEESGVGSLLATGLVQAPIRIAARRMLAGRKKLERAFQDK